jgi:basic membrane lipoprotein Med (substrate-binding protein (PBP1-ABC) superfamily)
MPILNMGTEFSYKWANLAEAQVTEGIRDPIIAYEYMNRYYVVEGNKRVSVLKYYNAVSISAIVTRKIPKYSEDEDVRLYYEYMKFNEITGLNTIEFTKLGNAQKLLELMGQTEIWTDQVREDFNRVLFHFDRAYKFRGGDKLPITIGDALIAFLNVYGYEEVLNMNPADYSIQIIKAWNEIVMMAEKHRVGLVMDPSSAPEKKNLLNYFLPASNKKFTVAFLYPKSPETSDWIYGHELGRNYLEETFSDRMETICVCDVNDSNIEQVLNDVIEQGAEIIFGVAPQMMKQSLKVAVEHPEVKILNCSLNTPHKYIRTYYARMYEAKFLSGMIAGAMAENDRIAYIADYPIYGMIANINAFALGASCTNPRAKVYLEWSTKKGYDLDRFLLENDIHYVSDQDMITPKDASRQFGLYRYEDGVAANLVMPLWNWGIFYEKMIQSILAGSYQSEGNAQGKALNYWWGMSAGVIDLIYSNNVPTGLRRMAAHLRRDICKGDIVPFYGEIYAQDGTKKNEEQHEMEPEDIMKMDYLVENVVGSIPPVDALVDGAKAVVELKGVEENK